MILTGNSFSIFSPLNIWHGIAAGRAVERRDPVGSNLKVVRLDNDLRRICTHTSNKYVSLTFEQS